MSADERQVGGDHYKKMAVQPWDVMEAVLTHEQLEGYMLGNILKYMMRAGHKGDAETDLAKAKHYREKLLEIQAKRG